MGNALKCLIVSGNWNNTSNAGVGEVNWNNYRDNSNNNVSTVSDYGFVLKSCKLRIVEPQGCVIRL